MNQIKNNIRKDFTICPNELINDEGISRDARFLFVWMASKPDDWQFWQSAMAKALGCTEKTVRKYTDELIEAGWMSAQATRTDGKFDAYIYTLNEKKLPSVKITVGKNYRLTNKDLEQTNTIEREREQFTEVMRYYRAKVNNRWEVSSNGKYRKRLSDLIHQGRAISDIKKVIDHRFAELERGDLPQYLVEPDNIFKHDLFLKTLNAANFKPAQKPKAVNGKNSGIQLAGEEDFKDKPSGWENYGI